MFPTLAQYIYTQTHTHTNTCPELLHTQTARRYGVGWRLQMSYRAHEEPSVSFHPSRLYPSQKRVTGQLHEEHGWR